MTIIRDKLDSLTPEQKAILEKMLRERKKKEILKEKKLIEPRIDRVAEYPITFSQENLWLINKLYSSLPINNIGGIASIKGDFKPEILVDGFRMLTKKHEILRTVFYEKDGRAYAKILPTAEPLIRIVDCENTDHLDGIIKQEQIKIFNLEKEPAFRVCLIRLADDNWKLLLVIHHLISDGASTQIIFGELITYYEVNAAGKKLREQEFTIQYSDYALWTQENRSELKPDYWQQRLDNACFQLDFFSNSGKLKLIEDDSVRIDVKIESDLVELLISCAKENKITLFSILLGSFYLTLSLYSGQNDLLTGVLVSGREITQISNLIGCFINVLPFKVRLNQDQEVAVFLKEVYHNFLLDLKHKEELSVYDNQDLEYQILFSFEEDPSNNIEVKGLEMSFDEIPSNYCKGEMELELNRLGNTIRGWFNYRKHLFSLEYMQQFAGHYLSMLKQIVSRINGRIKDIELLTTGEKRHLLQEFNPGVTEYEREATILDIFDKQVKSNQDKTALVMYDKKLTYSELYQQTCRIANHLIANGVCEGDKVAIMSERGFELIAGILGIIRSGAAYVPIDVSLPSDRKAFMIQDSQSKILLTDDVNAYDEFSDYSLMIMLLSDCLKEKNALAVEERCNKNSLAYIIYTSGTSGIPKGVLIEHTNVLRTVQNNRYYTYQEGDRLLQLSSYVFDGSVFDIFGSLLNGATLVLIKSEDIIDIAKLSSIVIEKQVNVLFITTSLFNAVIDINPGCFRGIRKLYFGGERASLIHARKAYDVLGSNRLYNIYGPTECTVFSTYYGIDEKIYEMENIPIGIPISNTEVCIVGKTGNIQPIGVMGEILIGGDGVARGYLNRPELTQEKFVLFDHNQRFYRTGDIGKWLPSGDIQFCGRVDDQIKLRGFRIELGEVENAIYKDQSVIKAFAALKQDDKRGNYLCAYLVVNDKFQLEILKAILQQELPLYMIPDYYITVAQLPLNENGKIDSKKLPLPQFIKDDDYVMPQTQRESQMAAIWADVLGVDSIGVTDNFFQNGGHSIKVAKMCAIVQKEMGLSFPLKAVFINPSIQKLLQYIDQQETLPEYEQIVKIPEDDYYEASFSQKRMYFAHELNREDKSYNIPFTIKLNGSIYAEKIENAINEIIGRHEILRTRFGLKSGSVVQFVEPEYSFQLMVLENNDFMSIEDLFLQFIQPFDLSRLPLFRFQLIKENNESFYLMGDFHHIIFDGVAMQTFLEELSELYKGKKLESLPLQYKDYAYWHNRYMQSSEIEGQSAYWFKQFADIPNTAELPTDFRRPQYKSGLGNIIYFTIDEVLTGKLRLLAASNNTTLNIAWLAIYSIFMHRNTGAEDIVIGVPVAGRRQNDVQKMIGLFLNTLAIRICPKPDKLVRILLDEVKSRFIDGFDNQDYPFEQLVDELQIKRSQNRNPLFSTMLIIQNSVTWDFDFGDAAVELLDLNYQSSKFDMQMEVFEQDKTLKCLIAYADDLFERDTVLRFINQLQEIADWVCDNENELIGDMTFAESSYNSMIEAFSDDFA